MLKSNTTTRAELFNMDCIEGMSCFLDAKFDLVFTDPPYNVALPKEANKTIKRWRGGNILTDDWDKFTKEQYEKFTKTWMKEAYRLLRPKGWFCVWCSWRNIPDFINIAKKLGLQYRNLFTFAKTNPALSFPIGLVASCEYVLVFYKHSLDSSYEKYLNKKQIMYDYVVQPAVSQKERELARGHPTVKPLNITEKFIKHLTKKGDWVLDPFMGSGTAAVACQKYDRNCVGFEINRNYYKTALKRIETEKSQERLKKWV